MNDDVVVSVCCLAYNHEKYIRNALEGFVNQKTSFKYEVYVHDDASTDSTANIIREYAEKYPSLIKPIYQTENQYSKGIRICSTFIYPLLKGKYIAECEGDDFWSDENKLQAQIDWVETHPEYSACVHNSIYWNQMTNKQEVWYALEDRDLTLVDVISQGGIAYHTSSLLYKREYLFNYPEFMTAIPEVGDYPFAIFLVLSGKIRYFGKSMSVHRVYAEGSWTSRNRNKNPINLIRNQIEMLNMAKEYAKECVSEKYDELFLATINEKKCLIYELTYDWEHLRQEPYISILKKKGIKYITKHIIKFLIKKCGRKKRT